MLDEVLEERLRAALPGLSRLGAMVRFDLGKDGRPVLDARSAPATLSEESDDPADCTITISKENLLKLMDGKLDPMLGYTLGKIRVAGSLGIAMKLVGAIS
ncbi:MAG: SCP2 sterol-binding domain-containing protein [Phyllobacteriaceae bacterium]|nr:SCP2 sterol-binding domain-containing protein [Phyllobacteriaceae bacterium]